VSSDYFKTIGIPMLRGRAFSDAERDSTQASVVISQRLATVNWPGKDPVGQQISIDNGAHWMPVVGVAGDVHQNGLANDVTDELYLPLFIQANAGTNLRVVVRSAADPAPLGAAIRSAVHELDPRQPVSSIQTMDELRSTRLSEPRVTAALLASFAVLALVITAAGLAGVIAYGVSQRLNEIGIRMALGAEGTSVVWLVMRQGLGLAAVGLVAGVALALSVTKLMKGLLFETPSTDVVTFAGVGVLLLAVVVAACLMPARRALKIDPVQALRTR
jgi:putative ABC transport system permease protein